MPSLDLSEAIADFISSKRTSALDALQKRIAKERKSLDESNAEEAAQFEATAEQRLADENAKFIPEHWLTKAAREAKQIDMVSHAPKYTHSDAKGSGVYFQSNEQGSDDSSLVHTGSINRLQLDMAGNAAALYVATLLQISDSNGETLLEQVKRGDSSALSPFSDDEELIAEWMTGLSNALKPKELSSHKLSKQLYFPLDGGGYHLIGPLFASSLAQEIHLRIIDARFSDDAKTRRECRRKSLYADGISVDYRNVAVQNFGGANKQNISQLNVSRSGRSFLFSCQPPSWENQHRPPKEKRSFWNTYDRRVWSTAKALREYLERIEHRDSNIVLREIRAKYVNQLVEELLQLAAEIQNLSAPAGWSLESKLPLHEQIWLDPRRSDPEFLKERDKRDWIDKVAADFSRWLNTHLNRSKKLAFGDVEFVAWKDVVEDALKSDLRAMQQ